MRSQTKHSSTGQSKQVLAVLAAIFAFCTVANAVEVIHPDETVADPVESSAISAAASASTSTTGTGPALLLLVDRDESAGTTALMDTLSAAGFNVTPRPGPEYTWDATNPPLTGFDCVVHLNGGSSTWRTPLPVTAQMSLVDFVRNGGGFIGSQWNGYERSVGQQIDMNDLVLQLWNNPGSNNCFVCSMTWTAEAGQEGHPVLDGVPSVFGFFAGGHDAGDQVQFGVDPSTVLMRSPAGGPAVLVREYANGRVVNFSHAANYGGSLTLQNINILKLYTNAASWACISRIIEGIGFEPPLDQGTVIVQKNRVLPMKAKLSEDGLPVTDMDIVAPPIVEVLFSSTTAPSVPVDVTADALTAGQGSEGNQFVFTDEGNWQFNLKTKNYTASGAYSVRMRSGDPAEYKIDPEPMFMFVIGQ